MKTQDFTFCSITFVSVEVHEHAIPKNNGMNLTSLIFLIVLERTTIKDVKLVRFIPSFFGTACSCTSTYTKVMEQNVKYCVFMFLQFCKKKFAKVLNWKIVYKS